MQTVVLMLLFAQVAPPTQVAPPAQTDATPHAAPSHAAPSHAETSHAETSHAETSHAETSHAAAPAIVNSYGPPPALPAVVAVRHRKLRDRFDWQPPAAASHMPRWRIFFVEELPRTSTTNSTPNKPDTPDTPGTATTTSTTDSTSQKTAAPHPAPHPAVATAHGTAWEPHRPRLLGRTRVAPVTLVIRDGAIEAPSHGFIRFGPTVSMRLAPEPGVRLTPTDALTLERHHLTLEKRAGNRHGLRWVEAYGLNRYLEQVLLAESAEPNPPPEALKALAIAARSYATSYLANDANGEAMCDYSRCLAFRRTDMIDIPQRYRRAVLDTDGMVLVNDHGHVVPGYFHSTCGGSTAPAKAIWPGPLTPVMPGVDDTLSGKPACNASPMRAWLRRYPRERPCNVLLGAATRKHVTDEARTRNAKKTSPAPTGPAPVTTQDPFADDPANELALALAAQADGTPVDPVDTEDAAGEDSDDDATFDAYGKPGDAGEGDPGEPKSSVVVKRSVGLRGACMVRAETVRENRVTHVFVSNGLFETVVPTRDFRALLAVGTGTELPSNRFRITVSDDELTVRGEGFGHGVGLCQYGARARAKSGATWRDILTHYYPKQHVAIGTPRF